MADTTTIETMTAEILGFETLVASYQGMVFGIAYHFLHDRSIAEEGAQDVFLQLYRKLSSIQSEAHAIAWLRKVTSHRCIDYSRRRFDNQAAATDTLSVGNGDPADS